MDARRCIRAIFPRKTDTWRGSHSEYNRGRGERASYVMEELRQPRRRRWQRNQETTKRMTRLYEYLRVRIVMHAPSIEPVIIVC